MAEAVNGKLIDGPAGCYCLVKTHYPYGYEFGDSILGRGKRSERLPLSAFKVEDSQDSLAPDSLLFLDTETTGLGGAGTVPFLVGCGSLVRGGFEIRQYLLPDYSDEAEMMEALLVEMQTLTTAVSYNGAAFDLPIIRDRMIINRVARELPFENHVDLLPPTRRIFRRRLGDCTLTNIERQLFGFHRNDDIPGFLIPSVYFSWLSSEETDLMASVLKHNCLDVLAMYFLIEKLAKVARTEGSSLDETEDIYSLSRLYGRRKNHDKVLNTCRRLAGENPGGGRDDILLFRAQALKRSGDWDEAIQLWQGLCQTGSRESYQANLELAMYFEHKAKDTAKALHHTRQAGKSCPDSDTHRQALNRRLNRLTAKKTR